MTKERPLLVAFDGNRNRIFGRCFSSGSRQFWELKASSLFCKQNDAGSSSCIFLGIVVIKFQRKFLFEVCEAMASIANKFRPRFPRDLYTIEPIGAQGWNSAVFARCIERLFVEIAVLNESVAFKKRAQGAKNTCKVGSASNGALVNAVKVCVERLKFFFGIDQKTQGGNFAAIGDHSEANLANAVLVSIGSLNIHSNESVCSREQFVGSWADRDILCGCCRGSLIGYGCMFGAAKNAEKPAYHCKALYLINNLSTLPKLYSSSPVKPQAMFSTFSSSCFGVQLHG